jgi:polyhydroxyalkanoate synthesis regulator phasin
MSFLFYSSLYTLEVLEIKLGDMRTKTFLELLTLSSNLYLIAKDTNALEKIHEYSEKGKDKINDFVKEKITDSEGNELEFVDKMVVKLHEAKEELEGKIESVVVSMYDKMNIAHTDQIKNMEEKLEALTKELSLAASRIKDLEGK